MITNFKVYERLGYNSEVSKLADYIWNLYKQGKREIDLSEYSKNNLSIFINKLIIEEINDEDENGIMYVDYDYYNKTKDFKITINKIYKPSNSRLEHELKHMWDYIINNNISHKQKDRNILSHFQQININDDNVKYFIKIIYFCQLVEIEAYYQQDIKHYITNKNRFKDFNKFFKYSYLQRIYRYLNKKIIRDVIEDISDIHKQVIMNIYYNSVAGDKLYRTKGFKKYYETIKIYILDKFDKNRNYKKYSDEEVERFFKKIELEIENKKKVYLKYIGRLYSYFN